MIRPYLSNPRDNEKSISRVANSIQQFGFLQPIVCDKNGVIIVGHTRYAAAKSLGLETVPVIFASSLTQAQARAYRLADNKAGEESKWIESLVSAELELLQTELPVFDMADFGFTASAEERRLSSWKTSEKRCGLVKKIALREKCDYMYTSFFATSKTGKTLEEIKADKANVIPFADNLCDYLLKHIGGNLQKGDWCLCATPRRRHSTGFHFATEICREAANQIGIPFYEDALCTGNRDRIHTDFSISINPKETNVILYDDIITTGMTVRDSRKLLMDAGHNVFLIVAIRNQ